MRMRRELMARRRAAARAAANLNAPSDAKPGASGARPVEGDSTPDGPGSRARAVSVAELPYGVGGAAAGSIAGGTAAEALLMQVQAQVDARDGGIGTRPSVGHRDGSSTTSGRPSGSRLGLGRPSGAGLGMGTGGSADSGAYGSRRGTGSDVGRRRAASAAVGRHHNAGARGLGSPGSGMTTSLLGRPPRRPSSLPRKALCPVCRKPVVADDMLSHVETCLDRGGAGGQASSSGATSGRVSRSQTAKMLRSRAEMLRRRLSAGMRKLKDAAPASPGKDTGAAAPARRRSASASTALPRVVAGTVSGTDIDTLVETAEEGGLG